MNISYNWLKDVIDVTLSPEELANELTRVGLAVDSVHSHGDDFVLAIDLTSHRPDCLSHLGVARELRASTGAAITGRYLGLHDNATGTVSLIDKDEKTLLWSDEAGASLQDRHHPF